MKNMTLENCTTCPQHRSYQDGYVMCGFYRLNEQRIINRTNGGTTIVGCPKE